jgi:hypothetical protein
MDWKSRLIGMGSIVIIDSMNSLHDMAVCAGWRNSGGAGDTGAEPAAGERGAESAQHATRRCAGSHPGLPPRPHRRAAGAPTFYECTYILRVLGCRGE